jgi:hypothetical protein
MEINAFLHFWRSAMSHDLALAASCALGAIHGGIAGLATSVVAERIKLRLRAWRAKK